MNLNRSRAAALFAGFALGALATPAGAQSVTVFGNGAAQECYQAALYSDDSIDAVQTCDYALDNEALTRRDRAATHINRGVVLVARRSFQEAFDDYETAREMFPDMPEVYLNRGNVYFYAERWNDAIADYDQALELGIRQERVALFNRGMAYEYSGDLEAAEADYVATLEVSPEWGRVEVRLRRVRDKMAERANGA